ncbi:class I SAM-dependent methyltransferase [Austwickia chelonae]|uniref:class I SAM-dependent methyltransferase n=1 Tax=Austwickia chelonae TaxID=100225 RepID=UPI000E2570C6|nr:class I SAM-dependent methyltransferase [Austwickia chelonae]
MSLWASSGRATGVDRIRRNRATPAVIPSPNIWNHPQIYEIENRSVDPEGLILSALCRLHPPEGQHLLDLGCGTGFHLPAFASLVGPTGHVTGVEPHPPLVSEARRRVALDPRGPAAAPMSVLVGAAQDIPLPENSVDIVHARWAYFFGPGCEPGLAELARVLRPGGSAFLIDNDASRSTFGSWFRREHPNYDPIEIENFWKRRGFTAERVTMRWQMHDRADFEAVVRIEFSPRIAANILEEYSGDGVDYAINIWHSRY